MVSMQHIGMLKLLQEDVKNMRDRWCDSTIARRKTGLIHWDMDWSSGCYTLYAPQTGNGLVKLIDISGEEVRTWKFPVRPGRDAVILRNGNIGYNGSHERSMKLYPALDIWHGGHFMEMNPKGNIVWEYEDPYHHHDAQWLENGNLLYTAAVRVDPGTIITDVVREVNRNKEVVWEWKALDHLDPRDPTLQIHECFSNDHWPMINGLYQMENGLVLMSLRTCSGVIAVDKKSGSIKYWINYPDVAQQHCPFETKDGNVLIFDNGNIRPASIHHSRIVEYNLETGEKTWEWVDEMPPAFFSPYMGSVEELWNGSVSICESAFGRIFEVNRKGELMWEYVIPEFAEYPEPLNKFITGEHNSCFKVHRYHNLPPELMRY